MHPVLVYAFSFVIITIGLLFVFEHYAIGGLYMFIVVCTTFTVIIGKVLTLFFSADDPMQKELAKEESRQRSLQYQREIQFLYNIVQPDPKLQPTTKRVGESLCECFDLDEKVMLQRIRQFFGESFEISLNQPLPDLIEQIKHEYNNWPS